MSKLVRIGVVGTSWWADLWHLPSLKSHPAASVMAICGRTRDPAEALARKYSIPAVFSDYREMIDKGNLDAVIVAAPDDVHYAVTMDALEAGLHVLCEKPLAVTSTQARAMYVKAEAAGVRHMTFFTYRWMPYYRHLRQLVDDGIVGRGFHCSIRYIGGYGRSPAYGWRFDRRRGSGILGDLGSHAIDLARWYMGEVVRVSAHLATFVARAGPPGAAFDPANDTASLLLEFKNGAQGTLHVSAAAHVGERGGEQAVRLYGEGGTLEADASFEGYEVRALRDGEEHFQTLTVPDPLWEGANRSRPLFDQVLAMHQSQSIGCRAFVDAILEGRPASPSFYDGWKAQQVIEAALESHASGRWVDVP